MHTRPDPGPPHGTWRPPQHQTRWGWWIVTMLTLWALLFTTLAARSAGATDAEWWVFEVPVSVDVDIKTVPFPDRFPQRRVSHAEAENGCLWAQYDKPNNPIADPTSPDSEGGVLLVEGEWQDLGGLADYYTVRITAGCTPPTTTPENSWQSTTSTSTSTTTPTSTSTIPTSVTMTTAPPPITATSTPATSSAPETSASSAPPSTTPTAPASSQSPTTSPPSSPSPTLPTTGNGIAVAWAALASILLGFALTLVARRRST